MVKKLSQEGFSAFEVILILIIVVLIGAVGYFVYNKNKSTATEPTATHTPAKSSAATNTNTAKPNPYDGWETADYAISGMNLRYPSNWSQEKWNDQLPALDHGTLNEGYIFTGSGGFTAQVLASNDGHPSGDPQTILLAQPVDVDGRQGYLDYTQGDIKGQVGSVNLSSSPTDAMDVFSQKISHSKGVTGNQYLLEAFATTKTDLSIAEAKSDPNYIMFRKMVESIKF